VSGGPKMTVIRVRELHFAHFLRIRVSRRRTCLPPPAVPPLYADLERMPKVEPHRPADVLAGGIHLRRRAASWVGRATEHWP
jgi:hypothetical protein